MSLISILIIIIVSFLCIYSIVDRLCKSREVSKLTDAFKAYEQYNKIHSDISSEMDKDTE